MKTIFCFAAALIMMMNACSSNKEPMVLISTNKGDIKIKLYNETPQHRDNFLKNVESGAIDSTLFHRVIQGFMIQGGDPDSKNARPGQRLGSGSLKDASGQPYRVPAEFNEAFYHKRGAVAAARDNNPEKASSSCQFYIVDGKKMQDRDIENIERQYKTTFSDEKRKIYKEQGGAAFLDGNYTVFGEVVEGMDVVDAIAASPKDPTDRPKEDIRMRLSIIK